jgi:hypothetical protein
LASPKYIYLEFGGISVARRELKYSINSLLAEVPDSASNIVIYTDTPATYAADAHIVETIDISAQLPGITQDYVFRAKPWALLHALRRYDRPCVFFDTDTFMRPGFARALKQKMARGAVMNSYLRRNPFPSLTGFEIELPHAGTYRYDPAQALMYNSGLIAAQAHHVPIIEDAMALMEGVLPPTRQIAHDQEQFAINEAFRIHGVPLDTIDIEFVHYCSRWWKKYMRWRLARMPHLDDAPIAAARPSITVNKSIARAFKFSSLSGRFLARALPSPPRS